MSFKQIMKISANSANSAKIRTKYLVRLIGIIAIAFLSLNFTYTPVAQAETSYPTYYREKKIHNPDGIGKYYMKREIAQVMGHQAITWLERDSRIQEEKPDLTVQNLNLKPDDVVADIGAGSGYFSFRIAQQVPNGKVYAVDIQPEMLEAIALLKEEQSITNIETVLGQENNPNLPSESIDLALMVDAYHEFAYPREMMEGIVQALKPGGRVVLLEYRKENPMIMIKPLHKMTQKQVKKELQAVGLKWQETKEFLPEQHFLVFSKNSYKL
jgi:ubiquinone/menaquinone biosynthesis C-methylase UbiE